MHIIHNNFTTEFLRVSQPQRSGYSVFTARAFESLSRTVLGYWYSNVLHTMIGGLLRPNSTYHYPVLAQER